MGREVRNKRFIISLDVEELRGSMAGLKNFGNFDLTWTFHTSIQVIVKWDSFLFLVVFWF